MQQIISYSRNPTGINKYLVIPKDWCLLYSVKPAEHFYDLDAGYKPTYTFFIVFQIYKENSSVTNEQKYTPPVAFLSMFLS